MPCSSAGTGAWRRCSARVYPAAFARRAAARPSVAAAASASLVRRLSGSTRVHDAQQKDKPARKVGKAFAHDLPVCCCLDWLGADRAPSAAAGVAEPLTLPNCDAHKFETIVQRDGRRQAAQLQGQAVRQGGQTDADWLEHAQGCGRQGRERTRSMSATAKEQVDHRAQCRNRASSTPVATAPSPAHALPS